ncbi:hypothetical protein [Clostridium sp. HBUAS56017]|uniref:hypothetical protein n=1 Tax=Clostridium sp. HBUAS56017 TaxID=2571128 RepID=UPI0011787461|nr:hypothetical protein [Clostridium sp. HBUAS56017]
MRKTNIIGMLILFLLIITGCSLKNNNKVEYKYNGENDNWKIEYKTSKNKEQYERILKFTYKGDLADLKSSEVLKYSYKTDINHGSGEI